MPCGVLWLLFFYITAVSGMVTCNGHTKRQEGLGMGPTSWNFTEWNSKMQELVDTWQSVETWQASQERTWKKGDDKCKYVFTSPDRKPSPYIQDKTVEMDDEGSSANEQYASLQIASPPPDHREQRGFILEDKRNRSQSTFQAGRTTHGSGTLKEYFGRSGGEQDGDVVRMSRLLTKMGFYTEEDLDMLAEASFESSAPDAPAPIVYKLWRALVRTGTMSQLQHGKPSYPLTLQLLKRASQQQVNAMSIVQIATGIPEQAPLPQFGDGLWGHSIKYAEDSAHDRSQAEMRPLSTSTGTPAYHRVRPKAGFNEPE